MSISFAKRSGFPIRAGILFLIGRQCRSANLLLCCSRLVYCRALSLVIEGRPSRYFNAAAGVKGMPRTSLNRRDSAVQMKIPILGWGSLINEPRGLSIARQPPRKSGFEAVMFFSSGANFRLANPVTEVIASDFWIVERFDTAIRMMNKSHEHCTKKGRELLANDSGASSKSSGMF